MSVHECKVCLCACTSACKCTSTCIISVVIAYYDLGGNKENRSKDESYNRQRPLPRIIQSIATTIDKKETVSGVEGESDVTHKVFSSWLLIAATAEDL